MAEIRGKSGSAGETKQMAGEKKLSGPDFGQGISLAAFSDAGMLEGHTKGERILVARCADNFFAIGASCTHYGGPLAEGLIVDDTVRCPWHHACFSLRTGEALRAPALDPVSCWKIEISGDKLFVREKQPQKEGPAGYARTPTSVIIVGGGAAGNAGAETLRRQGYSGAITMISADNAVPYDRPNLSKDFLAGTAAEDWIPLRSMDFYHEREIEVLLNTRVAAIDPQEKSVLLADGARRKFDALLLATGAEPVRLKLPGGDSPHVCYLRSLSDCHAIIGKAAGAKRVVLVGASFIAMEVAASLIQRKLQVHVVAPEAVPMERNLGQQVGEYLRLLHERHGVVFHLQRNVAAIDERKVTLNEGESIEADLVVIGIGVKPLTDLAERAGIKTDNGVWVNEFLETSVPQIFAAGDIARWPDPLTGDNIRVEHWVVAERQGQTAARNILGHRQRFDTAPFFWTSQYDFTLNYVGHAGKWDKLDLDGSLEEHNCKLLYKLGAKTLAVATVGRDRESLEHEVAMETALRTSSGNPG
jgi:NADPH-dependent 2,4-dienoyl-CoA reductase/sulfur reductase-like enzyme/nitrite reductase/ring-hydroxylating ferredoxin subunit